MGLGAQPLDDLDPALDARAAEAQVVRADAEARSGRLPAPPDSRQEPNRASPSCTSASTRFIAGEPMNAATNRFAGRSNSRSRRVALLQHAAAQHGDPLAERHRLDLVVGDVDRGHAQPLVQAAELRAHRDAELGVEVAKRLVHQERLRLADDRAPHRDPLALAAGQLAGLALHHLLQPQDPRDVVDPRA